MSKHDISVQELVNKVQRGELQLPEMQRRYVWTATRVRDLLDSLYRGYPSGTILVWETDENFETRELAVKPTKTPTTSQTQLLLDGQQRITSLTAILTGNPVLIRSKRARTVDILFNLDHPDGPPTELVEVDEPDVTHDYSEIEDEKSAENNVIQELDKKTFAVGNVILERNPIWIPVSSIFVKTDKELLKPIGINSDDPRWDKYSTRLNKVRKIKDYQYVMQVLEKDKTYEEVAEIFVRVNSLGMKLRGSDLAMAQITSKWKGFTELLEKFADEFDEDSSYLIDTGILVRSLVVFSTKQSKFKTVGKINLEKLKKAWEETKTGLRFAINFLRNNANIDSIEHLSSPFIIIPIAVFAILNNEKLNSKNEKLLLRWIFLAHMRSHYSLGSSDTILDADVSRLFKNNDLNELLKQLELHVKKFEVDSEDLANKTSQSPFFSMMYFVLKNRGAKDWHTGLLLREKNIGKTHNIQYHHIFPKSILQNEKYDRKDINDIANLSFIGGKTNRQITNKRPEQYFKTIIEERGKNELLSQLIPENEQLWKLENYKQFLEERRKLIASAINEFIDKL